VSWRERRALSLKLWLFGPAILIVVTFNAVILGLVWEQHSGYRQLRQIITDQNAIQAQLQSIAQNRSTQQQDLLLYTLNGDAVYLADLDSLFVARMSAIKRIEELSREYKRFRSDAQLITSGLQSSKVFQDQLLRALKIVDLDQARRHLNIYKVIIEINSARLKDLSLAVNGNVAFQVQRLESLLARFLFVLLTTLCAAAVLVALLLLGFRARIVQPLRRLQQGIRSLITGQLGRPLKIPWAPREILEMILDFNMVTRTLAATQDQLTQANSESQQAAQHKAVFLSTMSHEIRTPLNSIIGMTELLEETPLSEEQSRYCTTLSQNSDLLLNIVNDVLDYSRLESGQVTLECITFDLRQLASRVLGMMQVLAAKKDVALKATFSPDGALNVKGDPRRIEQIILNLLANAVKFTERGEVALSVSMTAREDKQQLEIHVRDTGIGMDADKIPTIFSPFTQSDATITRRFGGTGLGLSIVKETVERMGGHISVVSEPKRGSDFKVELCLETGGSTPPPLPSCRPELPQTRPGRMLLVDDSPDNRLLITVLLKGTGWQLATAENGAEAVETFQRHPFDVILMDMQMPIMDGYEATKRIRQIEVGEARPRACIIALTANALPGDLARSIDAGCDQHLTKPIRKQVLYNALATMPVQKRGSDESH